MVGQGIPALHQGLDAVLVEGEHVDIVPAQAIGQGVVLAVLGPHALHRLVGGHGGQRLLTEECLAGESSAKGRQIGGGGVDTAAPIDGQGLRRQGPGLAGGEVGLRQTAGIKVVAGDKGALQSQGLRDLLCQEITEVHAAGRLNHQLGQGEAVVGVDAVGPRVRLEGLGGEPLQQVIGGVILPVGKEEGAGAGAAHKAGRVVQEHPHGDILIPLVGHGEVREVGGDRLVQIHLAILHQEHHGRSGVDLADGARPIEDIIGNQAVLRQGVDTSAAREDDLPIFPQGILYAGSAAVLHSGLRLYLRRLF